MSDSTHIPKDNPAGRLHELISKAKAQPDSSPVRVWASVFGFPIKDNAKVLPTVRIVVDKLIEVRELVDDAEHGIESLQLGPKFLEPFEPIRKVLDVSLSGMNHGMSGVCSGVDVRHLTLLEIAASEWSKRNPDPVIDNAQLEEVLKQAQELFAAVKNAEDIPEELRTLILSMLAAIEQAIRQYEIKGPQALEKGLVRVLGELHYNSGIVSEAQKDPASRDWLQKAGSVAGKLWTVVTFADKTRKGIEAVSPIVQFLTAGDPSIPPIDLSK